MKVEIRESSKVYGETSPQGDSTREEKGYQIGAEIDGVWIPFASVGQAQLDVAAQKHEHEQAQSDSGEASDAKSSDSGKSKP